MVISGVTFVSSRSTIIAELVGGMLERKGAVLNGTHKLLQVDKLHVEANFDVAYPP